MECRCFLVAVLFLSTFFFSCSFNSDESILRKEFKVPDSAELTYFKVSPEEAGWFGREGLKIDAYFKLSDEDFDRYLLSAERTKGWLPLPISKNFLMHMFSIKSSREYRIRYYKDGEEPLPDEGSVYNPSEEQLLEAGIKTLPVTSQNGIFTLKAAGNDIMHEPKKTYTNLDKDLNDFMLAILDFDQKKLFIKVSTNY
jgi:hypothetical protein